MDKKRVMVVDDEKDFLFVCKLNLEQSQKFEVLTLLSAKDILARFYDFKPHIILLDLLMPGVGGLDACEILNGDPLVKNTPIIILSALEKDTDKLNAYKLGVVDYLVKPVEIKELICKIEKALK